MRIFILISFLIPRTVYKNTSELENVAYDYISFNYLFFCGNVFADILLINAQCVRGFSEVFFYFFKTHKTDIGT